MQSVTISHEAARHSTETPNQVPAEVRSYNVHRRALLLVLTVVCALFFLCRLHMATVMYLDEEKGVEIEINKLDLAEFPSVTVCNQNPYKRALVARIPNATVLTQPGRGVPPSQAETNLMFLMASLPIDKRMGMTYNKAELIRECSFNGKKCDLKNDFKGQFDPSYGTCYTFNPEQKRNTTKIGPKSGLRLLLSVGVRDYMPTTELTGVRMVIHDGRRYPFPDSFGYSIGTGSQNSFGITQEQIERVDVDDECILNSTLDEMYKGWYSEEGCLRKCLQMDAVKTCNCSDPHFPLIGNDDKYCNLYNQIQMDCLKGLKNRTDVENCDCDPPCVENTFKVGQMSSLKWPPKHLKFPPDLCIGTPEACVKQFSDNGCLVEVYYEDLNQRTTKEYLHMDLVRLFDTIALPILLLVLASFLTAFQFGCCAKY